MVDGKDGTYLMIRHSHRGRGVLLDIAPVELTCSDGGDVNYVIHFELYLDCISARCSYDDPIDIICSKGRCYPHFGSTRAPSDE